FMVPAARIVTQTLGHSQLIANDLGGDAVLVRHGGHDRTQTGNACRLGSITASGASLSQSAEQMWLHFPVLECICFNPDCVVFGTPTHLTSLMLPAVAFRHGRTPTKAILTRPSDELVPTESRDYAESSAILPETSAGIGARATPLGQT